MTLLSSIRRKGVDLIENSGHLDATCREYDFPTSFGIAHLGECTLQGVTTEFGPCSLRCGRSIRARHRATCAQAAAVLVSRVAAAPRAQLLTMFSATGACSRRRCNCIDTLIRFFRFASANLTEYASDAKRKELTLPDHPRCSTPSNSGEHVAGGAMLAQAAIVNSVEESLGLQKKSETHGTAVTGGNLHFDGIATASALRSHHLDRPHNREHVPFLHVTATMSRRSCSLHVSLNNRAHR